VNSRVRSRTWRPSTNRVPKELDWRRTKFFDPGPLHCLPMQALRLHVAGPQCGTPTPSRVLQRKPPVPRPERRAVQFDLHPRLGYAPVLFRRCDLAYLHKYFMGFLYELAHLFCNYVGWGFIRVIEHQTAEPLSVYASPFVLDGSKIRT